MRFERMLCWEATDATDAMTVAAGKLYEQTLAPEERIPWEWIERSLMTRLDLKPGTRRRHLLLAAPEGREGDPDSLAGYAYGAYMPGFGGYLCYMGVAEWARRHGVGSRLFEQFFRVMALDAGITGEPLPFVLWESHRPRPEDPDTDWKMWNARVKLFDRVGGQWIEGIEFQSPSWLTPTQTVPLQLFLKPMEVPAASYDPERLKAIVGALHEEVYRHKPGNAFYDATLVPGCSPRLKPAKLAAKGRELAVA